MVRIVQQTLTRSSSKPSKKTQGKLVYLPHVIVEQPNNCNYSRLDSSQYISFKPVMQL
jgi:hypothetical protein